MAKVALLMGAGDIASQLQPLLQQQDFSVLGVRRNPDKHHGDWPVVAGDAKVKANWDALLQRTPEVIVLTLTPTQFSDQGYEEGYVQPLRALKESLAEQPDDYKPLVVFVSSTSVYGQKEGEEVDEESPTEPEKFTGKRLLEAEQLLRESACQPLIVRLSGIYGPGRERMVASLYSGDITLRPSWTNRIHSRDVASVLSHLIGRYDMQLSLDDLYLASDNEPVKQRDFVLWLAQHLGLDTQDLAESSEVGPRGSKRCNNTRLRETGFHFIFPSYKEGYGDL
ncbi:NAD(P)-dependent oxidoreductase [Aliidiomarina minuta]|uniref:NAD(P)-dependent oxidoreductase n=1 Tax=Aliidiomarina minuta TaxID=880057 RepID=A0A432W8E5_9GAMM|nr:sugar nucleotide-binding protein [Aliidiomarina minuta]RUO26332.1 NAD(P)-dependent oxidoreductase [Aliidiomarina minuta]